MSILVVDGMGGGLGAQIVAQLRQHLPQKEIVVIGTNSAATTNMMRAGGSKGATGQNALRVCLKDAECVIGPIGIILADAMLGEITQEIAYLISSAAIPKVLIPVQHKGIEIIGLASQQALGDMIKIAVQRAKAIVE